MVQPSGNHPGFQNHCIHELFEARVRQAPDAVAMVYEEQHITYAELDRRAQRLAFSLAALGVGPETLVGICMERSCALITGLLGALKAGAAYVPLDPAYPQERLVFLLTDARVSVLLTQPHLTSHIRVPQGTVLFVHTEWDRLAGEDRGQGIRRASPENLAYVIYTSGSTGRPKGVMIPHRALVQRMLAVVARYGMDASHRVSQFVSTAFDPSVEEIFSTFISGGSLVLLPNAAEISPSRLLAECERLALTTLHIPPIYWNQMVDALVVEQACVPGSITLIVTGGESPSPTHVARWLAMSTHPTRVINAYGPTETTTTSTCYEVPPDPEALRARARLPIGRPVEETRTYLLDAHLRPVPPGEQGELYIGGSGPGRGYLHHPDLTAAHFLPDPFASVQGMRLYKTGDLARCLPDGNLEFLARVDHQVKLRGVRIELGEIEATLRLHPQIQDAAVILQDRPAGNPQLIAYCLAQPSTEPVAQALHTFLQAQVPDVMVPTEFVFLAHIPLLPSGKLDRKALPTAQRARRSAEASVRAPGSLIEKIVMHTWAHLLDVDTAGTTDNFFVSGGHSLLAMQLLARLRETLAVEVPIRFFFEHPTIADLAAHIERALFHSATTGHTPIQPAPASADLPLSFSQERVWFLQHLDPANMAYSAQAAIRLTGPLVVRVLERCLAEIVRRHAIFRTTFEARDGRPRQVIHATMQVRLPVIEVPLHSDREATLERLIHQATRQPFDLARLPLVRWALVRLSTQEHILLQIEHHLVHDGWSFNVFLYELVELYTAFAQGASASPLPDLPIQFADFALWQRQWMQGEIATAQESYWREQLKQPPPALALPFDHRRPAVQSFHGALLRMEVPQSLYTPLLALTRSEGVTLYMTMLAAFLTLLVRSSGQSDICIGTGMANRRWRETEGLIGMMINTVVVRVDLSGDPLFHDVLHRVRQATLEAYANQDLPFERIVGVLQPERTLSQNPLFQVMFTSHETLPATLHFAGLTSQLTAALSNSSAKFDLNVTMLRHASQHHGWTAGVETQSITMLWEYNTDLFEEATIRRLMGHYQELLKNILSNPRRPLSALPLLREDERAAVLGMGNAVSDLPAQACLHEQFEREVANHPDACAVVLAGERLTYQHLNACANQLAHFLQQAGVQPETLVGICLDRSFELIISILAILKAGGAYVPLDPDYPEERLTFLLHDSGVSVLLTRRTILERFPASQGQASAPLVVCLEEAWPAIREQSRANPCSEAIAANLAYVIYTSGSTGQPKGTLLCHANAVRLFAATSWLRFTSRENWTLFHSPAFDFSVWEIWGALLSGGCLVIVPAQVSRSAAEFAALLYTEQVTVLNQTPSAFRSLLGVIGTQAADLALRFIIFGGEAIDLPSIVTWSAHAGTTRPLLVNMYGITETTVHVTSHLLEAKEAETAPGSCIGRPLRDLEVYILDAWLQPVPIGVAGELFVGGACLARGYLHRPALTAERFLAHPYSKRPGERLYKTGDLARFLPSGDLEYLGRIDQQVKLRGYRIEPGEIEAALQRYPGIQESLVVLRQDVAGPPRLVAYLLLSSPHPPALSDLRAYLKKKLPAYMLPSDVVCLEAFPLTAHGKIDRHALPAPTGTSQAEHAVAPRNAIEELLAHIWCDLLGRKAPGVHESFFEIGGHSLLVTQVMSRVYDTFQVAIPLRTLFEFPTIAAFADVLAEAMARQFAESTLTYLEQLPEGTIQSEKGSV